MYYLYADPEGKVKQYPELFKPMEQSEDYWTRYDVAVGRQKEEAGVYQTWNDKWIIQNLEPEFNKRFRGKNRQTHKGFGTKVWFGPFSVFSTKYYDHYQDETGKIKDLRE